MAKNLTLAQAVREVMGLDYELMFDALNGWDLSYVRETVCGLKSIGPRWTEEPFPSERVNGVQEAASGGSRTDRDGRARLHSLAREGDTAEGRRRCHSNRS